MTRRARTFLALAVVVLLAAGNLACNVAVGVGVSVPIGGAWGGGPYGYGHVGVTVPIGH
jgi:predicted small secreted protein